MCALSWGGGGGGSNVTKVMGKVLVINTKDKHYTEDFKFLVYTEAWMSVFSHNNYTHPKTTTENL